MNFNSISIFSQFYYFPAEHHKSECLQLVKKKKKLDVPKTKKNLVSIENH